MHIAHLPLESHVESKETDEFCILGRVFSQAQRSRRDLPYVNSIFILIFLFFPINFEDILLDILSSDLIHRDNSGKG